MVTKRTKVKKILAKKLDVPLPLPKNKLGETLGRERAVWFPQYFIDSWAELKKVTWTSRKESWKLTMAVILFTALFTIITTIADLGFNEVVERVLL